MNRTPGASGRLGLAAGLAAGVAMTGQHRVNGAFAQQFGDAVLAAAVSFGLGLVLLSGLVLVVPAGRRGLAGLRRTLATGRSRWQGLGGLFGAFLVTSQCLTVEAVGLAAFAIAVVAGQTMGGLLIDSTRLAVGGRRPVTGNRLAGALLVVAAVAALHLGAPGMPASPATALLPALAGAGVACQHTLNGRVREACGSSLAVAWWNFLVGTVALAVVAAVEIGVRGLPEQLPTQPALYLGGPLGVLYVGLIVAAVRGTGVLLIGLTVVLGQVLTACAATLLAPGEVLAGPTAMAAALAILAVGVARGRAPAPRSAPG